MSVSSAISYTTFLLSKKRIQIQTPIYGTPKPRCFLTKSCSPPTSQVWWILTELLLCLCKTTESGPVITKPFPSLLSQSCLNPPGEATESNSMIAESAPFVYTTTSLERGCRTTTDILLLTESKGRMCRS